ncbi:hypothetical protein FA15DRAFT_760094 [Coprinopsis marcescibilis]|uniref:Uncharacterized protein n=1 Tax=Coprinopsis marcescibilis TaxID=230819 RepID=A0A5C3KGU1_COPMA|nr:hypothetical protein FA15DRAFT_760094 [Coprinopsis marcescibilis]
MVFGLNFRRNSRFQSAKKKEEDEDQWHIRYTGPYEPPRETPRPARPRDSWGDPLDGEDEEDAVLADKELQERFREYRPLSGNGEGRISTDEDHKVRGRDRAFSLLSGRTVSSGAVDPTHSVLSPRRSTVSSTQRPPMPAYVHIDPSGGVGQSPAPLPHPATKEVHLTNRLSLASIFSFGSSSRKFPSSHGMSPSRSRKGSLRKSRPLKIDTAGTGRESIEGRNVNMRGSISSEDVPVEQQPLVVRSRPSQILEVAPEDYYNSYYSTLIPTPALLNAGSNHQAEATPQSAGPPSENPMASSPVHPYAYTFPKRQTQDPPPTAPATSNPSQFNNGQPYQRLAHRQAGSKGMTPNQLKNSTSTPNLRNNTPLRLKPYAPPSMKDRWLSAETWCDAILFPRPRFKVREHIGNTGSTGRIVSPPDSPVDEKLGTSSGVQAVPSRVLAHSRSLGNLKPQTQPPVVQVELPQMTTNAHKIERPPRPKSFAADDLALINPAFSLEQVIEEGQELEHERRQWQIKAVSSLGNARARSLARTRSKSLTQKGRKGVHNPQTSIDYLAARACLGSQNVVPDVFPPRPRTASSTQGTNAGRASHSHSNSLVKTLSKTSKHSRSHSHSESWSKSAKHGHVKASSHGRGTDLGYSPNLEGALRREDTKVIRLPDPALIPVDTASPPRVSPIPSVSSDVHMGIAISTPPPPDDLIDLGSIRMPTHPYAQAGLYTTNHTGPETSIPKRTERLGADYAGPHPTVIVIKPGDVTRNHTRAPVAPASNHPYARAVSPEIGLVAQTRQESTVPVQEKMWAQLSPGVVREVLPEDISYSPFLPDSKRGGEANGTNDSVGLGEALSYSNYRDSRDSGLGTSENHIIQPYIPSSSPQSWPNNEAPRVLRKPVQYDVTRPSYPFHTTAVAFNSTPERAPSSDLLLTIPEIDRGQSNSPAVTSGTPSPQPSPPRSIGSPNNLDDFHDLFYQPSSIRQSTAAIEDRPLSQTASLTWEMANQSRRTGSGLATLARQLSEEFEQLERERTNSEYSSGSFRYDDRTKANHGLRFVFEEELLSTSPTHGEFPTMEQDSSMLINPTFNVPEDVASFVGSTEMEKGLEDEDDTAVFRVGTIEPLSTPPTESVARRLSFVGLMSYDNRTSREHPRSAGHLSSFSGLQPPGDGMRSSYMTTSTTSRISGLSDFPSPPKDGESHMSLLASYFDDSTLNHQELQDLRETPQTLSHNARDSDFGFDLDDSRTDTTHTQR